MCQINYKNKGAQVCQKKILQKLKGPKTTIQSHYIGCYETEHQAAIAYDDFLLQFYSNADDQQHRIDGHVDNNQNDEDNSMIADLDALLNFPNRVLVDGSIKEEDQDDNDTEDEDMDRDGNNDTNDSTNTTFDTVVTAAAAGDNDVQHGIDDDCRKVYLNTHEPENTNTGGHTTNHDFVRYM